MSTVRDPIEATIQAIGRFRSRQTEDAMLIAFYGAPTDVWFSAVANLRRRGHVSREETAYLLNEYCRLNGLGVEDNDGPRAQIECYRTHGETEIADLLDTRPKEHERLCTQGKERFRREGEAYNARQLEKERARPIPKRVAECMAIIRALKNSRTQRVDLSKATLTDHSLDEWYEAIQRLNRLEELYAAEVVYLTFEFLRTPGLAPYEGDPEYERLSEQWHPWTKNGIDRSPETRAAGDRVMERETAVIAEYMRRKGDGRIATLLEHDFKRFVELRLEGEAMFEGGRQLDMATADANAASEEGDALTRPLDDESVAVRWCMSEIRTLLARGITDKADIVVVYVRAAPTRAWFRAIGRLRAGNELSAAEAAFLLDSFYAWGTESPDQDDGPLHVMAAEAGERELAELYESDPERFERLRDDGERAFKERSPFR